MHIQTGEENRRRQKVVSKKRVLYFNNQEADYLADSVLIGLIYQQDVEVFQYPVKQILLQKFSGVSNIYGKGFTLYNLLEDRYIKTAGPEVELSLDSTYDLVIFSSIHRQFEMFKKLLPQLKDKQVWILDGEDTPALYPFHGYYWRQPSLWFLPRAHTQFLYFKREWTPETLHYLMYKLLPRAISKHIPAPKRLRPISFSIPQSKICQNPPIKTKLFPKHIVDREIAMHIPGSYTGYAFESEQEYYSDLQQSMYGITTKRSGWDCLRHYEIAANGAVICFRDLDQKPLTCAPHGLVDGINCINYKSYIDLKNKIESIGDEAYLNLQKGSFEWVKNKSCESLVAEILKTN